MSVLRFDKVHVRQALGIAELEPLENLTPSINVVYGPNGSGKSTTLRLMQAAITSDKSNKNLYRNNDWLVAEVNYGDISSQIKLTSHEGSIHDGPIPPAGPDLIRDCRFSLSELIKVSDEGDHGRAFNQAASGGLDLIDISKRLGLTNQNSPRRIDRNNLAELRKKLTQAEAESAKANDLHRELESLEQEKTSAEEGLKRQKLLQEALIHHESLKTEESANQHLAAFPEQIQSLDGKEKEALEEAESAVSTAKENLEKCEERVRKAKLKISQSGLTANISELLLKKLKDDLRSIEAHEKELQEFRKQICGYEEKMHAASNPLGTQFTEELLININHSIVSKMAEWCSRVEDQQGKLGALNELKKNLGDLKDDQASSVAADIIHLQEWHAAETAGAGSRKFFGFLGWISLIGAITSIIALFIHSTAWIGLVIALGCGFVWLMNFTQHSQQSDQNEAKKRCQRKPKSWTAMAVLEKLGELQEQYGEEIKKQQLKEWKRYLDEKAAELDSLTQELIKDREEIIQEIGFAPQIHEKCFGLVAQALTDWQTAYGASRELKGQEQAVLKEVAAIQLRSSEALKHVTGINLPDYFNSAHLHEVITDLEFKNKLFQEGSNENETAEETKTSEAKNLSKAESKIGAIYSKIGCDFPNPGLLHQLLNRLAQYRDATNQQLVCKVDADKARKFFDQDGLTIKQSTIEELQQEITSLDEISNSLEQLNQSIGDIKGTLKKMKRSTAVEEKRAEFDTLRCELLQQRENMLSSVAGDELAKQLQREVSAKVVPEVQKRAGELLLKFTRGACQLVIAEDKILVRQSSQSEQPLELGELSDGTRAQLSIAVRLAFLEQGEQGFKLPLFFDEAFANSDVHRMRVIIDALAEIARDGRQIFYFTSQPAECQIWEEQCRDIDGVNVKISNLVRAHGLPNTTAQITPIEQYEEPELGESYDDYATRLKFSKQINPWISSADQINVFHILNDPFDLKHLLEAGVYGWGILKNLGPENSSLRGGEDAYRMAERRADFLFRVCELWQRGRGIAITRSHLEAAGLTNTPTAKRLDDTWEQANKLGSDAKQLCEKLENKEINIARVSSIMIDRLRTYCEENGLITQEESLADGEILLRASNISEQLELDNDEYQRLIQKFSPTD